ncbi:hypothetical protein FQA39_LY14663 [Lamprigera yunnana]|nr:hypothetical protein FQA39_LY14663 [Lamprigera yunnana]
MHACLYDTKHKFYSNKHARADALIKITDDIKPNIPEITVEDIASTSSYNSPPSPVYSVAPTIMHVEELDSNDKVLTKTKNLSKPRMPDFCYYCETEVLNFGRHIIRNHHQELEVQKIVSLVRNSLQRKRLIANLRKKENFLLNSESLFKPVHKSYVNDTQNNYIPCPFCFGIYSRKLLRKHKRKCINNKNPDVCISLGEGQNLLLPKLNIDSNLKLKVFPRMLADKISLTAKRIWSKIFKNSQRTTSN